MRKLLKTRHFLQVNLLIKGSFKHFKETNAIVVTRVQCIYWCEPLTLKQVSRMKIKTSQNSQNINKIPADDNLNTAFYFPSKAERDTSCEFSRDAENTIHSQKS